MSNEEKLIRALIDALGFEVKESVRYEDYTFQTDAFVGLYNPSTGTREVAPPFTMNAKRQVVDYKVTKKDEK